MKDIPEGEAVILRPLMARDLKAIHSIEMASFEDPWSISSFKAELDAPSPSGPCIVAEEKDGLILGYCICQRVEDELYIKKIAVTPTKKRCGIGRMLITFIVEYAIKNTIIKISLDCDEKNHEAQAFYEALGFGRATPRGLKVKKIVYVKDLT